MILLPRAPGINDEFIGQYFAVDLQETHVVDKQQDQVGALQGIVIAKLGLPSFVVTLAGQLGLSGLLLYLINATGGIGVGGVISLHNSIINDIENGSLSATASWIVMIALVVVAGLMLFLKDRRRRVSGLVAPPLSITLLKVAVIAIDKQSIDNIGRWPWPRDTHARMIDLLADAKAAAVGYLVFFSEPENERINRTIAKLIEAAMFRIANEAPADIRAVQPALSAELAAFLERALAKNPDERFQTGEHFAGALRAATGAAVKPATAGGVDVEL